MRKSIIMIICLSLLVFTSTSIAAQYQKDTSPVPNDLRRDHESHLIVNGMSWITINHQYIGKAPKGDYKSKHNYKAIDTDFYNWTLVNHTPYTIEFLEMKTWPERTTGGVSIKTDDGIDRKSSVTTLDLTKVWKYNTIGGNKTWNKPNYYYYSQNKTWNKRYAQYKVRINGNIYTFTDTLVYIK